MVDENLDHYAEKIDELVGRLDNLIDLQQSKNAITITHKQEGNANAIAGAAFACCAATVAIVIGFMIMETRSYNELSRKIDSKAEEVRAQFAPQVDQLRAWNDVHTKDIARLQAGQEKH